MKNNTKTNMLYQHVSLTDLHGSFKLYTQGKYCDQLMVGNVRLRN